MVGLRWGTTSLGAPTPCGSPCAASKEAFQQLSAEEHNKSTTRAQHVSDRTDQTEQGFTIRSKPDPSTRRATSGFIGTMHHAHHRCKRSAGHFPVWHCFCPRSCLPRPRPSAIFWCLQLLTQRRVLLAPSQPNLAAPAKALDTRHRKPTALLERKPTSANDRNKAASFTSARRSRG